VAAQRRPTAAPRAWGQHFLGSGALAERLVAHGPFSHGTLVVEVGPGTGRLTHALARRGCRVLAVEVDPRLARDLEAAFVDDERVQVVEADFLAFDLPREPFVLAGNIPFALTAEIVRKATRGPALPEDVYFVMQAEAAERFAGTPWAPESLPSLRLKPWWHVEIGMRLPAHDFEPPPSVDAAVLWLSRRARPLVSDPDRDAYLRFVERSFGRGRHLRQALRTEFSRTQLTRLARDLRLDLDAPPSEVDFARWLALFRVRSLLAVEPVAERSSVPRRYT
jgi:23S rRNA (adenine-N6)-dimethyltransferase